MAKEYQVLTSARIKVGGRCDLIMAVGQALELVDKGYPAFIERATDTYQLVELGPGRQIRHLRHGNSDTTEYPIPWADQIDRILINMKEKDAHDQAEQRDPDA